MDVDNRPIGQRKPIGHAEPVQPVPVIAPVTPLDRYLATLTPMRAAKARAALLMWTRYNGGRELYRRHVLVERLIAEGYAVAEHRGQLVLMGQDGAWLDKANITATGLAYAASLGKD